jgi:uncharacterized membrane protein YqaE (UPF0057 family)
MKKIFPIAILAFFLAGSTLQSYASFVIHKPVNDSTKNEPVSLSAAVMELRHLSRSDKRARIKEAKSVLKEFKAQQKAGNEPSTNTVLLVILAILLPPLAVYLHEGVINGKFWLDLILTLLLFLPGVIYALIVVLGKS